MRYAAVARSAYGVLLLLVPGAVIRTASGEPAGTAPAMVGRILGLRHLVQALAVDRKVTRDRLLAGAVIDAAHALSMVALAAASERHRQPAALDAAMAGALAANGLREARNA